MTSLTPMLYVGNRQSMSSHEIAEITGKKHKNIIRDIKNMLDELDGSILNHEQFQILSDNRGYTSEILLSKNLTLTLITGYNASIRYKVNVRWQELESNFTNGHKTLATQNHALKAELLKANNDYKALAVMYSGGLDNSQMGLVVGLATSTISKKLAKMRKLGLIGERHTDNQHHQHQLNLRWEV